VLEIGKAYAKNFMKRVNSPNHQLVINLLNVSLLSQTILNEVLSFVSYHLETGLDIQ